MYQAYNNYIIVTPVNEQVTTLSGIITTSNSAPRYLVVKTNETTKNLQNKTVVTDKVKTLDTQFMAVDYNDIIAVVE